MMMLRMLNADECCSMGEFSGHHLATGILNILNPVP
jgi:hypothetical protein